MPTHSIYSVRDKKKVDAEVIDVREVSGAKGVRYQIVGQHPEDGTTVTTFCSAAVAEDFRAQLGDTAQHAAESVDHIPQPEAPVISTDGTPIDDDLDTFVEDPLVGSISEGTITTAKVLAAEGELSKTSCCCGATEDKPCACMTADEPMQCSSTEPKCACYAAKGAEGVDPTFKEHESFSEGHIGITSNGDWAWSTGNDKLAVDIKLDPYQNYMFELVSEGGAGPITQNEAQAIFEKIKNHGYRTKEVVDEHIADFAGKNWRSDLDSGTSDYGAETVAGIDVQTPSQIAIETPDSDELVVPDPDLLVNGDGRVLGQQTGAVNTTPMHAEEDDEPTPRALESAIAHASDRAERIMQEHIKKGIVKEEEYYTPSGIHHGSDDDPSGFTETGREIFEMFYSALVEGTDESDICYYCGTTDDVGSCWSCDVSKCIDCDDDEMRSDMDGHTYCDSCEPDGSKAAESNFTEDQVTFIKRKGYQPDMVCSNCFSCFEDGEHSCQSSGLCGCSWDEIDEYDAEPAFARNKRVLIPTAVIGGLALAYLAKPELLSGSFDKISDMLGKLTKSDDKTE